MPSRFINYPAFEVGKNVLKFPAPEYWQQFFAETWNEVDQNWEWSPEFLKYCPYCCVEEAFCHSATCPKTEAWLNTSVEVSCLCCGRFRDRISYSWIDPMRNSGVREVGDFYMFGRPSLMVCRYCALNYLLQIVDGRAVTDDVGGK